MKLIGLTGGIGSGKSTVRELLAARGAATLDADQVTRDLQEPGTPVFAAIVERFGPGVVADGHLDRPALASLVFDDPDALRDLNKIVHPAVGEAIISAIAQEAGQADVFVLEVPLLVEGTTEMPYSGVLVVDVDEEIAVERVVASRGMSRSDAMARIRSQASRAERRAVADFVIDNSGDRESLERQVDAAFEWMGALPR